MDGILAPCARRSAWTRWLLKIANSEPLDEIDLQGLELSDKQWVERNIEWSRAAADCIKSEMAKFRKASV
jgi:hypothetical protein